jgi:hypothetical protein
MQRFVPFLQVQVIDQSIHPHRIDSLFLDLALSGCQALPAGFLPSELKLQAKQGVGKGIYNASFCHLYDHLW